MYKAFYGLSRNPFGLSPDPYFLYPTKQYNDALSGLYYGIRARKGLVVLTGEVGTGKTMLVRCLLSKLEKSNVHYGYVFNTRLSPPQFLRYLAGDLGLKVNSVSKSELLLALSEFLIRRHNQGAYTVLVIDEGQLLRRDVLEEIRLLVNLETTQHKLIQVVLVGQPELDVRLDSPSFRQLKQRIALRFYLQPLCWEEVRGYVHWRLQLAGAKDGPIFPENVIRAIYEYSKGIPRLINCICENLLIAGYACSARSIPLLLVEEVCRDLRLSPESVPSSEPSFPGSKLATSQADQLWRRRMVKVLQSALEAMEMEEDAKMDLGEIKVETDP